MINQLRNKTMEHETSQNLIKVELTVKQLTSILINFDYLNKLAKERGKSLIAIKYSNDIEPFKKALNYTLAEDPRQFSAEECDLLYWANKFVNDPDVIGIAALADSGMAKVEMKTIRTEESPQKHYNSQSKSSIKEINIAKKQLDEDVDRNSDSYIRYIFELISKCFKG